MDELAVLLRDRETEAEFETKLANLIVE